MSEPLSLALSIIEDCQRILTEYLPPDGPDAKETISRLLELLDGPRWRELKDAVEKSKV